MSNMKELFEKVAKEEALQAKFNEIVSGAEQAGEEATGQKLLAFAKDAGFDVKLEEMQEYFRSLVQRQQDVELSDMELDMVAGGKSEGGAALIFWSVVSLGLVCGAASAEAEIAEAGSCGHLFE